MLEKHIYCVKCQAGKTIVGHSPVVMQNGSTALKGRCPSCDSVAYKIVKKDALKNAEQTPNSKEAPSDNHLGLALATFALGLAIGGAIAMYL